MSGASFHAEDKPDFDPAKVLDQWSVFDATPEHIEARMKARESVGGTDPEYLQLKRWVAIKKAEASNPADYAGTDFKNRVEADASVTNPWNFCTAAEAKTNIIAEIKKNLGAVLSGLSDADKATLIKTNEDKLTAGNDTIASMKALSDKILADKDAFSKFTSIADAQAHLDALMKANLLQKNAATPPSGALPGGEVATNDDKALEDAGYNPYVLESKTVMGQMFEAFLKSFTTRPWQLIFEAGMRIFGELFKVPAGMFMTLSGFTLKLGAYSAQAVFAVPAGIINTVFLWPINALTSFKLGYLAFPPNMRTLHGWGDGALKAGKELDSTLPLGYRLIAGVVQRTLAVPARLFSTDLAEYLKDAGRKNLNSEEIMEDFKESAFTTPFRALQLPGGAAVWNTASIVGSVSLLTANMGLSLSSRLIGMAGVAVGFSNDNMFMKAANYFNSNTRDYRDEAMGAVGKMLTPPFYGIFGLPPDSKGGRTVKNAGYTVLEEAFNSKWFGAGNMGRWLSEARERGTLGNNPSIKTEAYLEKQQQKLAEIDKLVAGTGLNVDAIKTKIKDGNYYILDIDKFIKDIAKQKNDGTLDKTSLNKSFASISKNTRNTLRTLKLIDAPAVVFIVAVAAVPYMFLSLFTLAASGLSKLAGMIRRGYRGLRGKGYSPAAQMTVGPTVPVEPTVAPTVAPQETERLAAVFNGLDQGTVSTKHKEWDDWLEAYKRANNKDMPKMHLESRGIPLGYQVGDGTKYLLASNLMGQPVKPLPASTGGAPSNGPTRFQELSDSFGAFTGLGNAVLPSRLPVRPGNPITMMRAAASGVGGYFESMRREPEPATITVNAPQSKQSQ